MGNPKPRYEREYQPYWYRADCDMCDAWETGDDLARLKRWAIRHRRDDHADDDGTVDIWRRLGQVNG